MTRRALVTGAAGFIGSALCKQLVATGWDVVGYDALTYAAHTASLSPELERGKLRLIEADICNARALGSAFEDVRPTHVFHLAAESHVDRSIDQPENFIRTNVTGTAQLLEKALSYWKSLGASGRDFRLLHVSTDEVFGALGHTGVFTELSPYAPRSPYAASKAASDHMVRAWNKTFGLPTVISNCCNNFGPRQFPEKLLPLMVLKALNSESMPIYGDGLQVRDWLHVDDHARALIAIAERGAVGETYLVGAEEEHTNLDLVKRICAAMDTLRPANAPHSDLITHVDDRPGHDFRYAVDASKLRDDLEWAPQHRFEYALEETVRWYLENPDWWQAILDGSYRGERLGLRA